MVSLLIFPLVELPVSERFSLNRQLSSEASYISDWNTREILGLNRALVAATSLNFLNWRILLDNCKYGENDNNRTILRVQDDHLEESTSIPAKARIEFCRQMRSNELIWRELFSRDEDAFRGGARDGSKFESPIYAVVLLYQGEYYGHIYIWISHLDPERLFAIGIRSLVDMKLRETPVDRVSGYLFEGIRQFANAHGVKSITVTNPYANMQRILPYYGFKKTPVPLKYIGNSLAPQTHVRNECQNCWSNSELSKPLINEEFSVQEIRLKESFL